VTLDELKERRIALLGFGVENRALGQFLTERAIDFSVCDIAPSVSLRSQWPQVSTWHLGPTYLEDLSHYDLLFRTPGLPNLHPSLQEARLQGGEVSSQMKLFFALCPCPILGITGTKGKGTTTTLLENLLKNGQSKRVFSGGNIGRPPISFLENLRHDDLAVLELSSFQLQDIEQSPSIALALSITQDHLDHHATRDEYVEAKKNIGRYQVPSDTLITHADCITSRSLTAESVARQWSFSTRESVECGAWVENGLIRLRLPENDPITICRTDEVSVPGRHNWENICAAISAAAVAGASPELMRTAIIAFRGLPHRLEFIGERNEIAYYNDSLATTPDAACAALRSFSRPVILIAGGASKGADFTPLGETIASASMRAVILLGAEGTRIEQAMRVAGYQGAMIANCTSLEKAVSSARELAQTGDLILLSPACASFDMFANYKERGDLFKKLCGFLSGE
jgi:UDP-N-acetylmuramoylalanine--D-glutamate ligase